MNLIFMNSLERKVGQDRVKTVQVSICEHQGSYIVAWNEPDENGEMTQVNWYEGVRWDEMLGSFRLRLAEKLSEGYYPLLSGLPEINEVSGKAKQTQMLEFYSELHPRDELFESLRKWRREQSSREGKPAYILATNRVLKMISVFLPQNNEELRQIPGLGESKVSAYGGAITAITKPIERQTTFPLDWVSQEIDQEQLKLWALKQQETKLKVDAEKQVIKRKLLEGISLGHNLTELVQKLSLTRRELLLSVEDLDKEGYDVEPIICAELLSVPKEEQDLAWKAFEHEGDRYLKPVLKKVFNDAQLSDKQQDRAYEWLRLLRLRFRREKDSQAIHAS